MKYLFLLMVLLVVGYSGTAPASQAPTITELESQINRLKSRVEYLEYTQNKTKHDISTLQEAVKRTGPALLLFAIFCAWWAKSTGRSALGWFFLGLLFHVITGIALLIKTERGGQQQ